MSLNPDLIRRDALKTIRRWSASKSFAVSPGSNFLPTKMLSMLLAIDCCSPLNLHWRFAAFPALEITCQPSTKYSRRCRSATVLSHWK